MTQNQESATSFLTLVTSGKIREAYTRHVASNFRHHNPYFKGDADSLMAGMEENETRFPRKVFKIHHVVTANDLVMTHSHVTLKPGEIEIAAVHIFRFENGKIAELWDVGQAIPAESPNENGMF